MHASRLQLTRSPSEAPLNSLDGAAWLSAQGQIFLYRVETGLLACLWSHEELRMVHSAEIA